MTKIYVPYGTTEGQTAKIAEYIADVIQGHGHEAHTADIKRSGDAIPDGYDAVIVGASIHMGKHDAHVGDFVRKNLAALERLPSAFFSVSLAAYGDTAEAESYVEEFEQDTGWRPATVALFGGALLYTEYGFLKRHVMKKIARDKPGNLGTDTSRDYVYTEWDGVRRFAEDFLEGCLPDGAKPKTTREVCMTVGTATGNVDRTRVYRNGRLEKENFPVEDVSDYLSDPDTFVWVDLCGPDAEDLDHVAEELGLHALAIEDALEARQRPKLDRYADHQFLSMYAVALDRATGQLQLQELAAFITATALVTVRKDDAFNLEEVVARWDESMDLARYGVGFLLYGLIDRVVDGHFDAVQALDDEIEQLEDLLFESPPRETDVQRRSFALRKSLVTLRRVVLPMREVVNTLLRRDIGIVTEEMTPYFQDVYDHVLRATEWTESLRDLVTTILETNLTIQGNRLNVITKKVTSWAAIIAVPTAITGFYGQNLPYPGFARTSGFIWSSLLIIVLSGGLYVAFKRRGWL